MPAGPSCSTACAAVASTREPEWGLSYAVCVRRAAGARWQPRQMRAKDLVVSAGPVAPSSAWAPESSLRSSPKVVMTRRLAEPARTGRCGEGGSVFMPLHRPRLRCRGLRCRLLRLGHGAGQFPAADPDSDDPDEQSEQRDPRGNKERTGKADRQGVIVDGRRRGGARLRQWPARLGGGRRRVCGAAKLVAGCHVVPLDQAIGGPGVATRQVRGHHRIVVIRRTGTTQDGTGRGGACMRVQQNRGSARG